MRSQHVEITNRCDWSPNCNRAQWTVVEITEPSREVRRTVTRLLETCSDTVSEELEERSYPNMGLQHAFIYSYMLICVYNQGLIKAIIDYIF